MSAEVYIAIAGFLCGVALLYLITARTMKKRGHWRPDFYENKELEEASDAP